MKRDACTICYFPDNIMPADKIQKERDTRWNNLLLVCHHCFDTNMEIPTSGGRS